MDGNHENVCGDIAGHSCPQRACDDVAPGKRTGLDVGDAPSVNEFLHLGVIHGDLLEAALGEQIGTGITDVEHGRAGLAAVLLEGNTRQRRPRGPASGAQRAHRGRGAGNRLRQQGWRRELAEFQRAAHRIDHGPRGDVARVVAAHPIRNEVGGEGRAPRVFVADAPTPHVRAGRVRDDEPCAPRADRLGDCAIHR